MNGLTTIRALQADSLLTKEFDCLQDVHSSAWYLFISSSKAFGSYIDNLCAVLISVITYMLILVNDGYHGGDAGLVITQLINLCGLLQFATRQYAELDNHMTSLERVLEYADVVAEPSRVITVDLPEFWPAFGKIVFENVSMRYQLDHDYVLKNINLAINSKEKIGIVGRTGAGKTSILAALFQLYDLEGSIIIDNVDTTKLPLNLVRSKISIIPQEPLLFSGTIRRNLDPFGQYNDETLWSAIQHVELKDTIEALPAGLSSLVSESGSNFSVGQRQLVCLARAIIQNNNILVMDEATANVDPHTDNLIQKAIKTNFSNCTVITIAHRLNTIIDSDKIIVMDHGRVVEFDRPSALLNNVNGVFYGMAKATSII